MTLGMAVIGAGYWGPNLVRNISSSAATSLHWLCDLDVERAAGVVAPYAGVATTGDLDEVLADPRVEAVAIATPAATHFELALACMEAGRHVLVEKPLASSLAEGRKLVEVAQARSVTLMTDHTYCYTPAVRRIREMVQDGTLGDIHYVDSVRINLGLVQRDIDVIWDLAPHDLSILDFVLPAELRPTGVAAHGADPIGAGRACVGYLTLPLPRSALAHAHVNWLSPTKVRTTIIGGSRRTLVWDDLSPTQRLSLHDRGVELDASLRDEDRRAALVSYRIGDMVAPALPESEALQGVVAEFASAIAQDRAPATDGHAGVRVLELLEAASRSLDSAGALVPVGDGGAGLGAGMGPK